MNTHSEKTPDLREPSPEVLRILHLEDSPADAELIARELQKLRRPLAIDLVESAAGFDRALQGSAPDLILADNSIPDITNAQALKRSLAAHPGVPFIYLSGTIGEERAIERLKEGATDYVLKDNLSRLVPAVRRALEETREKRERSRAEETLRSVLESSLDAIVVTDARGRVTAWNLEAERTFGWAAREALGRPVAELLIPEGLRPGYREGLERFVATGEGPLLRKRFETRALRKGGAEFPVELAVVPIRIDGEIHFSSFVRDLSERKKAEEDQALLAEIVRSSQDAIVTKTLEGRITSWNKGAEDLFGYSAREAVGQSITIIIPEGRFDEERMILEKIARGERVEHFETIRRRKGGKLLHISLTVSPVRDRRGRLIGASKVARDVTEIVRAREEIRALNEGLEERVRERTRELEELLKYLDSFSYSVAHDLRSPLRAITGFVGILLEDYRGKVLDRDAEQLLRKVERSTARMNALIEDLLAYGHLAKGEFPTHSVALGELAAEVVASMEEEIRERGAAVRVELPLPVVRAHAKTLSQALTNLVSNAIKFVDPGITPTVRIAAEQRGGRVRLRVEDNGIGIEPECRGRIFGMFNRLHPDSRFPGTGMGLAIVKIAAERMGGSVGFESTPGSGSVFWIELPADGLSGG